MVTRACKAWGETPEAWGETSEAWGVSVPISKCTSFEDSSCNITVISKEERREDWIKRISIGVLSITTTNPQAGGDLEGNNPLSKENTFYLLCPNRAENPETADNPFKDLATKVGELDSVQKTQLVYLLQTQTKIPAERDKAPHFIQCCRPLKRFPDFGDPEIINPIYQAFTTTHVLNAISAIHKTKYPVAQRVLAFIRNRIF